MRNLVYKYISKLLVKQIAFFCLFIHSVIYKVCAIEDNYLELKKVEKEIKLNKKTYNDLKKIEKNLNIDINKFEYNVKRYNNSIRKAYDEKKKLSDVIKNALLSANDEKKKIKAYNSYQKKIIEIILVSNLLEKENKVQEEINLNILRSISLNNEYNISKLSSINNQIKEKKSDLRKINSSLDNIKEKVEKNTSKIQGMLGETLIAAIQKEEKKIETKNVEKRASELRRLIEKLEKNKKPYRNKDILSLKKLKAIYPVEKVNIENIRTDKSKKGILLTLKFDAVLKSPENGLVVYADFFKGYGNMVILDLGNGYHLIFSGLKDIYCKTGDWVQKNTIIGDVGAKIENNDIYMEVRFNGKTISPSKWFNS